MAIFHLKATPVTTQAHILYLHTLSKFSCSVVLFSDGASEPRKLFNITYDTVPDLRWAFKELKCMSIAPSVAEV